LAGVVILVPFGVMNAYGPITMIHDDVLAVCPNVAGLSHPFLNYLDAVAEFEHVDSVFDAPEVLEFVVPMM
jgi:hypothetical protein